MWRFLPVCALCALCACLTPAPRPPPTASWDFGLAAPPLEVAAPVKGTLVLADVTAAELVAGEGIVYRLAYLNAARPEIYAHSRWVAPPAELFSQRLLQRLASIATGGVLRQATGVAADWALRVEIEEFGQHFEAPDRSVAQVRVRAMLFGRGGALVGQKVFAAERPAPPNAVGAAVGLREAADEVIDGIGRWIVDTVDASSGEPGRTTR